MRFKRKVSASRVVTALAQVLVALFCASLYWPYPEHLLPEVLHVLGGLYIVGHLLLLGLIALYLTRKGEPLDGVALQLLLSPFFFLLFLAAGGRMIELIPLVLLFVLTNLHAVDVSRRLR